MTKMTKLSILCKHENDKLIFEYYLYFLAMTLFSKDFKVYELSSMMPRFHSTFTLILFPVGSLTLKYSFLQGETKRSRVFYNIIGGHRPYVTPMTT